VEEEGQPEGDTENICAVSSSRVSALESERFSEFCVSVPASALVWLSRVPFVHSSGGASAQRVYVGLLSGTIHPCLWLLHGLTCM